MANDAQFRRDLREVIGRIDGGDEPLLKSIDEVEYTIQNGKRLY